MHITRGDRGNIDLKFTVPFPCGYKNDAIHINDIDPITCPIRIELAVPGTQGGVCGSRLTAKDSCATTILADEWNETHVMNIVHQNTGNYKLTPAETEMKIYLRIFDFAISNIWSQVLLPVVNVMKFTYLQYIVYIDEFVTIIIIYISAFIKRYILMIRKINGREPVAQHTVILI